MEHEVFRQIDGTNYKVSNKGAVVNAKTGYVKKPTANETGHLLVNLVMCDTSKSKKQKGFLVHRLVAMAFPEVCGEWFEGCEVHHKDRDPSNNQAENLVVLTKEQHTDIHRHDVKSQPKRVFLYDKDWCFVRCFDNAEEASIHFKTSLDYIRLILRSNGRRSYKGFYLLYED